MKAKKQWPKAMAQALEVPLDLACGEPVFTLMGQSRATIENYRNLMEYTGERITVSTARGRMQICGRGLYIPCYTSLELEIEGCIEQVILETGRRRS